MRRFGIALVASVTALGAGAAATAIPAREPVTHAVVTTNNTFVPPRLEIVAGDSLVHANVDTVPHNVVSNDARPDGRPWFESELIGAGETASVPVENVPPGIYTYTCAIHGTMLGTIEILPSPLGSGESGETEEVSVRDSFFQPKTLTIAPGTTVIWRNDGQINHTVTAADRSWDSDPNCPMTSDCMSPGDTFSRTFTSVGTVPYYCKVHGTPQGGGMAGTIKVVDPSALPTTVTSLSASAGPSVTVSGAANFGGEQPKLAGEDVIGDPAAGAPEQLGVDLETVSIQQPDPSKPEIQFIWKVTRLDDAPPPEVVRYLWQMKVNEKEYWIQAKTSDLLSGTNVTDDPAGHAGHTQGAFKLRGNCGPIVAQVPSVTTCRHVMWLTGTFDAAKDEIRVRMPLGTTAAPEFAPGVEITPLGTAAAGFQAGVSNGSTEDQVTWDIPYAIPSKTVALGIAPAGTPLDEVAFSGTATLSANGSFSGSLPTDGLAAGAYDVWAKGCFADNCGTRKVSVTL